MAKSSRSKLLETWMSMDGDRVGRTSATDMIREAKKRVRMSLLFDPTISRSIGRPMRAAA